MTAAKHSLWSPCCTLWQTASVTAARTTPTYYMDGEISLGFRRLSIIDLEGGRQPILNEDKSKVLMFNGEIYNYSLSAKTF